MQNQPTNSIDAGLQPGIPQDPAPPLDARMQGSKMPGERTTPSSDDAGPRPESGGNPSTVESSIPVPSPTNFGFTTGQAVMTLVTLIGAILVFQSLRRINSKSKETPKRKTTGNLSDLMALRNEIYEKYPPPPRPAGAARAAVKPADPPLRLVDDRAQAGNIDPSHATEIAALQQQIEQLGTEVSHLRSRVLDLESAGRSVEAPFGTDMRSRPAETPSASLASDHEKVYRLADRGMSAIEIAKTLGQHTGQVELILNLRRATGS